MEKYKFHEILPKVKTLALLGDIGDPFQTHFVEFFYEIANKFTYIFYLAGNNEF